MKKKLQKRKPSLPLVQSKSDSGFFFIIEVKHASRHFFVLFYFLNVLNQTVSYTMSEDEFIHDIAIDISRALNLTNPNDLIARKVVQFAETNKDFDRFSQGKLESPLLDDILTSFP